MLSLRNSQRQQRREERRKRRAVVPSLQGQNPLAPADPPPPADTPPPADAPPPADHRQDGVAEGWEHTWSSSPFLPVVASAEKVAAMMRLAAAAAGAAKGRGGDGASIMCGSPS